MVGRIFLFLNLSAFLIVASDSSRPLPVRKRSDSLQSVKNQENAFARNVMRASNESKVVRNTGRTRALSISQELTSTEAQEKNHNF